jgi:hypothetical protein
MSALLGPDGNPMNASITPQIIGVPRSLEEFPILNPTEIEEFVGASRQILTQGMPLEIPAAMPMELMVRVAATLVHLTEEEEEGEE